ncbi:MAG: hypothetical protein SGI90_01655 [Candidatus Eisenbacteria bacterium]|nr:hypothetical protein [Candidatus Eisenbacteria bacterium]
MWLDSVLLVALLAMLPNAPASRPSSDELTQQVRATETAFAKSMADRDHTAFTACLLDLAAGVGRAVAHHLRQRMSALRMSEREAMMVFDR